MRPFTTLIQATADTWTTDELAALTDDQLQFIGKQVIGLPALLGGRTTRIQRIKDAAQVRVQLQPFATATELARSHTGAQLRQMLELAHEPVSGTKQVQAERLIAWRDELRTRRPPTTPLELAAAIEGPCQTMLLE